MNPYLNPKYWLECNRKGQSTTEVPEVKAPVKVLVQPIVTRITVNGATEKFVYVDSNGKGLSFTYYGTNDSRFLVQQNTSSDHDTQYRPNTLASFDAKLWSITEVKWSSHEFLLVNNR